MNIKKPMTLLLLEDNISECNMYKTHIETRNDVCLIGVTDSNNDGINYVKTHMPEGIILDLELHRGEGTGLDFLTELSNTKLNFKPAIIVTTHIISDAVYNYAHENGADFIFYKKQKDYSAKLVIDTLLLLRKTIHECNKSNNREYQNIETKEEQKNRIANKINIELDLIGVSSHLKGRKYLFDAIYYLLQEDNKKEDEDTVFQYLARTYRRGNSTISRAIQTSINHAWRISPIEDLEIHYTARINYETGVPTPTEFIYYYRDKIIKYI
jgi:Response regulator of citrate/malate metabolism